MSWRASQGKRALSWGSEFVFAHSRAPSGAMERNGGGSDNELTD